MFGTIAIFKPSAGKEAAVTEVMERWWSERSGKAKGVVAVSLHKNAANPAELLMTAIFDSEESYRKNADDPDQDKWYQDIRSLLDSDPHWIDGDLLSYHHA